MMPFRLSVAITLLTIAVYSASEEKVSNSKAMKTHGGTESEIVVCNQYIGQSPNNSATNEAIKKLDEKLSQKLDELTKLLGGKPSISPSG